MTEFEKIKEILKNSPKRWLVTGAAGFIGSHLVEELLKLDQKVVGFDNLSTGHIKNIEQVKNGVGSDFIQNFEFIEGDIRDREAIRKCIANVDYVLHQAALGSVPRSIKEPLDSHDSNVNGHLNILWEGKESGVQRIVYASSSSVYGDHPELPKEEDKVGNVLSPYAGTKKINEIYSDIFHRCYGLSIVGLRYFNVFGSRQDPNGAYAAVIPRWINEIVSGKQTVIYGDGETSRDFCYVKNVVQANILAATTGASDVGGQVFNVAYSDTTSLTQLYKTLAHLIVEKNSEISPPEVEYQDFRPGDIRHSYANIEKSQKILGYKPTHDLRQGLIEALDWYLENL